MPGVSREQVENAKKIDILTYLQAYEPDNLVKISANEYSLKDHDSLKISNGAWHWFSHGDVGGKTALDYLIKVRGMDFLSAVRVLCNERAPPDVSFQQVKTPVIPQKSQSEFTLPEPNWNNLQVIAYLQNRGIDIGIIDDCTKSGILYQSKKYSNCVFVGKDSANIPRFACVRSTINNLRFDVEGSDKKYSFNIQSANSNSRFVIVTESPIDTLSAMTLRKMCGETYQNYNYLSLDGTSEAALIQYLADHPKIDHVILSVDSDSAGQKCIEKIRETLKNRRISVIVEPPIEGTKDFNETLLAVVQKQKEHSKVRSNADIFI